MRVGLAVALLVAVLVVGGAHARSAHKTIHLTPKKHMHAHAQHLSPSAMDVAQRVPEIPEQAVSLETPAKDLEEEEEEEEERKNDVTRLVAEVPEQAVDDPLAASADLERKEVQSDAPRTGEKIEASTVFTPANQFHGDHLPENFTNSLLTNHGPPIVDTGAPDKKAVYDSLEDDEQNTMGFKSGNLKFQVHFNHAKNYLDASRVQVGTSMLESHSSPEEGRVSKYRVRFAKPFRSRPMVFVTTVADSGALSHPSHMDTFAASVSEVRTDHFVVNIARVDSLPNNGWGQQLYLDWVAMEYENTPPKAHPREYASDFLMTHPAFDDPQ